MIFLMGDALTLPGIEPGFFTRENFRFYCSLSLVTLRAYFRGTEKDQPAIQYINYDWHDTVPLYGFPLSRTNGYLLRNSPRKQIFWYLLRFAIPGLKNYQRDGFLLNNKYLVLGKTR